MKLLDGCSRPGAGRIAAMLATLIVLTCSVAASSAAAEGVIHSIPVGALPDSVSSDGTDVWVTNDEEGTLSEIEASSGTVIRTIPVGGKPRGVSSDGTDVWVTSLGQDTVTEIEASSGTVIDTIAVGHSLSHSVFSDGTDVWVTNDERGTVSEIEASNGTVIHTIPVGRGLNRGVSSDGTDAWVTNSEENTVSEIEASSGTVIRTIPVGDEPVGVSSDGSHVWVANSAEQSVSEIEASSGTVLRTVHLGAGSSDVSSDGTHVWVTHEVEGTVSEIEASSGTVIHTIHLGSQAQAVSSDGLHVWVTNISANKVSEIPTDYSAECSGNSATVTLSPGLTNTAAVQTLKIKGTMTACAYEPFTSVKYTATLKTAGPVSCSVLKTAGEPATGAAKYKWTPKAKGSTGILNLPLTETPGVSFAGEVTAGPYVPLTFTQTATEHYTGGSTCGETIGGKAPKAVKKGTVSGSAVSLLF